MGRALYRLGSQLEVLGVTKCLGVRAIEAMSPMHLAVDAMGRDLCAL